MSQSEIISKIINEAINAKAPYDVFVEYSGHVDKICVRINKNASYEEQDERDHCIFNEGFYLDQAESVIGRLNAILDKMIEILNAPDSIKL